jgi:hypothetical protein
MDIYMTLIIMLLIFSVANNFVMYNKCYNNKSPFLSPINADNRVKTNVKITDVHIYCKNDDGANNSNNSHDLILKKYLKQYEQNNYKDVVITIGNPNAYDYRRINNLN